MITPFNIYLIFQIDSIKDFLTAATTTLIILSVIVLFIFNLIRNITKNDIEKVQISLPPGLSKTFVIFLICLNFLAYAIPNTKTLCAMYALPAIVNSKVVQTDFPELYDIALQATKGKLQELVKPAEGKK